MARKPPKPYKPGLLVTGQGAILFFIALLAIGAHTALGVWVWDKPIATVAQVQPTRLAPVRVKRAVDEDFVFSAPPEVGDTGPSAEDLTRKLLESEPPKLVTEALELDVELRPLDELDAGAAGRLEIDLPTFELDNAVLAELDTRPPEELAFDQGDGLGGAADGVGDGPGSAELAGDALGGLGSGGGATGPRSATTLLDRAALDGPGGLTEVLPDLSAPLDAPPIDFTDLALGGTTKIDVPDVLDDDFEYRVTRYQATDWRDRPIDPAEEAMYFRVDITAKRSLRKLKTMPKDVIFLVDTSSSISPQWVEQVSKGVSEALVSLNTGDRFNVVLFNDKVSLLSEAGPVDAVKDNLLAASEFLNNAASVGYTDVNAALRGLLIRDIDPRRAYELVLISDGQSTRGVVDTRDLINLITRDNDLVASIYCVGVGRTQNRELLNFLAYRNKGYSVYADEVKDASVTIQDLMSRIRFPIIKDVRLNATGIDGATIFPADLPNIHQGETIRVYGRFAEPGPFTMRLVGRSAGKDVEFTFRRDLQDAPAGDKQVATQWAFWKLHDLYSLIIREGEKKELLDQIEALRKKYGLKTLY